MSIDYPLQEKVKVLIPELVQNGYVSQLAISYDEKDTPFLEEIFNKHCDLENLFESLFSNIEGNANLTLSE